ncbi:acyltransferase family protein [Ornithinibacillus xuwenensis]|uniref:Acyltransferase family protein n=1 Tax=Ornithinibacillus xuwenensis TaxID=3144668 RepID=A0ABU9XKG9_9BACI
MSSSRQDWIDIAKGIGIIAVVLGHAGFVMGHHYTYWFHMPLFFILSGLLYKPVSNYKQLKQWLIKRMKQFLIPYLSFGLLILLYKAIMHNTYYFDYNVNSFLQELYRLAFGGMMLRGIMTVFWFITCLLLTQILFALLHLFIKFTFTQIFIIFISYLFAHYYSIHIANPFENPVPWSADVVLIALAYYAFGYYIKQHIQLLINIFTSLISLTFIFLFTIYDFKNEFFYTLDLKPNIYNHILLDSIVPISIFVIIAYISKLLSKVTLSDILIKLGMASLTIMYLHRVTNEILGRYLEYGYIWYTIVGIIIPLLFHVLFEKIKITQIIFLGRTNILNKLK